MSTLEPEVPILRVANLRVGFKNKKKTVSVVDDVSFSLCEGRTLAIVGESGSGKSVTALSILRLLDEAAVVTGNVVFATKDLLHLPERETETLRGKAISMIFQEPMTSLNPLLTIGEQIAEMGRLHLDLGRGPARAFAIDMLTQVGISSPAERVDDYPHQLSGGMRQRVMIAIALACSPKVIIADEPTTALDVTIQAQILELLRSLVKEMRSALILITHDFGVVAEMADDVVVMYCGQIVERASVQAIFDNPTHPYTKALMRSMPSLTGSAERLSTIGGTVPMPGNMPRGCRFHDRCEFARPICSAQEPPVVMISDTQSSLCWMYSEAYRQSAFGLGSN